jgi:hypothetical protein
VFSEQGIFPWHTVLCTVRAFWDLWRLQQIRIFRRHVRGKSFETEYEERHVIVLFFCIKSHKMVSYATAIYAIDCVLSG